MAGYNEMLRRIEPEKIICYNTPFPEMEGDIVYVDYELSSWKYMNYERKVADEDIGAYKIGGYAPDSCDTMSAYMVSAGGGSAYGGDWKPSKDSDRRLVGNPGILIGMGITKRISVQMEKRIENATILIMVIQSIIPIRMTTEYTGTSVGLTGIKA